MEEINVKVVMGISGAVCDIDVPIDATVGELIEGLVNEGFLYAESPSTTIVLHNKDVDGDISSVVEYNDRSKTVKEYGWQNGQTIVVYYNCLAKPVIYLYPQITTQTNIKIKNRKSITVSYPEYSENGWNVLAYPDGTIKDLEEKFEYSYLFWEGLGQNHYDIHQGYVVHRDCLVEFFREKLSSFGLLPREYNEFIVYWYPILRKNKYNAISFFCKDYENDYKMDIIPKPDEILRIFMIYKKADKNTVLVPPDDVKPITRNGFTVIEWGGQLLE